MAAQTLETMPHQVRTYTERTEMPAGLTPGEESAYVGGYSRGCLTYVRKHGAAAVSMDGPAPAAGTPERRALGVQLAELTRAHEAERHPSAHRAAMAALRKYRKAHGIAEPAAPRKSTTRKAPARKLAAVPDVVDQVAPVDAPAVVESLAPAVRLIPGPVDPAPAEEETTEERQNRTRKLARRQLADEMRARGEDPRDAAAWAAAKFAAGVK